MSTVLDVAKGLLRKEALVRNALLQRHLNIFKVFCVMECHATEALRCNVKRTIVPRGIN